MKHLAEYRNAQLARQLVDSILAAATQRWVIMDVCGGQTHGLLRYGIEETVSEAVELIHGPGCPVCVTPVHSIDMACRLAARNDVCIASFGDMLRVPASRGSLMQARATGGDVRVVYSPLDAVQYAKHNPCKQVVFFAVGFETTAPATALAVLQAQQLGLENFSLLVAHVRVLPAMRQLMSREDNRVQAFLAAGHVCTVTGFEEYRQFALDHQVPVVVTGFEPLDLLQGIRQAVLQLEKAEYEVENCYARSVRTAGNLDAIKCLDEVYEIADCEWRGFGMIKEGGYRLRERFRHFDAAHRFGTLPVIQDSGECKSAEIMSGQMKATQCPHFGGRCTPDHPLGAPMVSSEGACAAYFSYRDHQTSVST